MDVVTPEQRERIRDAAYRRDRLNGHLSRASVVVYEPRHELHPAEELDEPVPALHRDGYLATGPGAPVAHVDWRSFEKLRSIRNPGSES